MSAHIRMATAADIPALHRLVAELAAYVGASDSFTTTIAAYEEDFAAGYYEALVAEVNDRVVGMALFYGAYSTWKGRMIYLEDFVIEPAYRRQGIGQQLWDALKAEGRGRRCKVLKWQVVNTNTEALKFYAAQDATIERDWSNGKLFL